MNVNISYSYQKTGIIEESDYEYREPCMGVYINSNNGCTNGWLGDHLNGRTILIIKRSPEMNHLWEACNRCKAAICDSIVTLYILSPGEENKTFDHKFKKLVRKESCDSSMLSENSNDLKSNAKGIHSALEAILNLSEEFFDTQDKWLWAAKSFIDQGPVSTRHKIVLDPALERNIRQTLGDQEGAMNLLEDLKKEPFNEGIKVILQRLLRGVYGDFSSEFEPTVKLPADFERRKLNHLVKNIYAGRYEHNGPNAQKNMEKTLLEGIDLLKNGQTKL